VYIEKANALQDVLGETSAIFKGNGKFVCSTFIPSALLSIVRIEDIIFSA